MMAENFPKQMKKQSQTEEILQMLQIRQKKKKYPAHQELSKKRRNESQIAKFSTEIHEAIDNRIFSNYKEKK